LLWSNLETESDLESCQFDELRNITSPEPTLYPIEKFVILGTTLIKSSRHRPKASLPPLDRGLDQCGFAEALHIPQLREARVSCPN